MSHSKPHFNAMSSSPTKHVLTSFRHNRGSHDRRDDPQNEKTKDFMKLSEKEMPEIHVDDFVNLMGTISTKLSKFFRDFRAIPRVRVEEDDSNPVIEYSPDERGLTDQVWDYLIESKKSSVVS